MPLVLAFALALMTTIPAAGGRPHAVAGDGAVQGAQANQTADKPGRYLLTGQMTIAEGKAMSRPDLAAHMGAGTDRAQAGTWWIAAGNITGDLRRITTFSFYDDFAAFERDVQASRRRAAAAEAGSRESASANGQSVLAPRASLAVLRDDLSFNPDKLPPSAARYWSVTTMFLKAGHMSDFAERTRAEIELLQRAGLDHRFLVYQVIAGVPSSGAVFYVITPMKTLAEMDADDSAKAAEVFTAEVRRRFESLNQAMISSIESDLLMVRPDLSRVPASYVAANPAFWTAPPAR